MIKTYALTSFLVCVLPTGICVAYDLVGTATLSEELVAQHYTINPNLDAVIVVDRTIPTFEYHTFYGAGSADEEEGQQGRIHFLEHVIAGIGSYAPGKLNQIIADNEGEQKAFTDYHFTGFILKFPKDKFDLAVKIDSERYYNTVINEEIIKKEKKIVLTERSHRLLSLKLRHKNSFFSLIYKKKNFNDLGTEAFIKQLESDDLKAYYENFLRRQKRLIVVTGDVDVDQVLKKLDEAYGNEQIPSEPYSPQCPNREVLGKRLKHTLKNLIVTIFRKGWYTPNLGHRDYAGLLILDYILDKSSNSLRSTVVGSKLASVFQVELSSYKGFSLMHCYAELPHDTSRNRFQNMISKELENLKSISDAELNTARNQQLTTMYSAFYNLSSMAYSFGQAFAHANDPLLYPKLIKDLKSIRRQDIPRIIDQYLTDDNSITYSLTVSKKKMSPP